MMEELNLEMSNAEQQSIINPVTPELPEEQPELPPAPQVEKKREYRAMNSSQLDELALLVHSTLTSRII